MAISEVEKKKMLNMIRTSSMPFSMIIGRDLLKTANEKNS